MKETHSSEKPETNTLVHTMLVTAHALEARLEKALEPHGLSLPKLAVLQNLVQAGEPLRLGVLSERLGCVKSNVTQLIDRLEADQLVRRVPDPDDRRSVLAEITEEGRHRQVAGFRSLAEAEREILAGLSTAERAQLARLVGRFGAGR